jgi:hypothetical protein
MHAFLRIIAPLRHGCAAEWISQVSGYDEWIDWCTPGTGKCRQLEHSGQANIRSQNKDKEATGELPHLVAGATVIQLEELAELLTLHHIPTKPPR